MSTFVYFISTGKLVIGFLKMTAVRDFFINSIYMIFDIIPLIHTNFTIVKNAEQKFFLQTKCRMNFRPAGRTQDDLFVLQGTSCRTKFLTPCPASCKTGRLSNSALQDAGQDAKNRPATFSVLELIGQTIRIHRQY